MFTGILIKESLQNESILDTLSVIDTKVVTIDNPAEGQSPVWTLISFNVEEGQEDIVAEKLSRVIKPGRWYIDFKSPTDVLVVFLDKVFHYKRGDAAGKGRAVDYALSIGVPESQLGWEND
jgi:hypothetical protein